MRLSDFIVRDIEAILSQWEAFAATQFPAARHMGSVELRDHARPILEAVAKDLTTSQTREEQSEKSMGLAPRLIDAPETAAQTHALLRAKSGFDINQMAAEYRALRASVLRLFWDACLPEMPDPDEVIRFNEAIDQALMESIAFFTIQVEQSRNLFLGMLGHDMRTPLQTINVTAAYLSALNAGEKVSEAAAVLIGSGGRMQRLLDDLVDFNRTKLGLNLNIVPTDVDVAKEFGEEIKELRAGHSGRQLDLEVTGDCRGLWDGGRLRQLLANLIINAIKYGDVDSPIRVVVPGREDEVRFEVRNSGPAIDQTSLAEMFDPLKRGLKTPGRHDDEGSDLGLGLYIAKQIAEAHMGEISVRSDDRETAFTVRLPRRVVASD